MPRRSPSPSLRVLQSGGSEQQDGGSQEACSASGTLAVERPASHGGGGPPRAAGGSRRTPRHKGGQPRVWAQHMQQVQTKPSKLSPRLCTLMSLLLGWKAAKASGPNRQQRVRQCSDAPEATKGPQTANPGCLRFPRLGSQLTRREVFLYLCTSCITLHCARIYHLQQRSCSAACSCSLVPRHSDAAPLPQQIQ